MKEMSGLLTYHKKESSYHTWHCFVVFHKDRLSQPLYLRKLDTKEKASEAGVKHAVLRGGVPSEASKTNIFSSIFFGPHPLPSQVFRFALASSPLAILSARSMIE